MKDFKTGGHGDPPLQGKLFLIFNTADEASPAVSKTKNSDIWF